MNAKLVKYIGDKHNGRTITGIKNIDKIAELIKIIIKNIRTNKYEKNEIQTHKKY
jgi:hypothetical protein